MPLQRQSNLAMLTASDQGKFKAALARRTVSAEVQFGEIGEKLAGGAVNRAMLLPEIQAGVYKVLGKLGIKPLKGELTDDTDIMRLTDSVEFVDLVMELEEEFEIDILDEDANQLRSPRLITEYVEKKLSANPAMLTLDISTVIRLLELTLASSPIINIINTIWQENRPKNGPDGNRISWPDEQQSFEGGLRVVYAKLVGGKKVEEHEMSGLVSTIDAILKLPTLPRDSQELLRELTNLQPWLAAALLKLSASRAVLQTSLDQLVFNIMDAERGGFKGKRLARLAAVDLGMKLRNFRTKLQTFTQEDVLAVLQAIVRYHDVISDDSLFLRESKDLPQQLRDFIVDLVRILPVNRAMMNQESIDSLVRDMESTHHDATLNMRNELLEELDGLKDKFKEKTYTQEEVWAVLQSVVRYHDALPLFRQDLTSSTASLWRQGESLREHLNEFVLDLIRAANLPRRGGDRAMIAQKVLSHLVNGGLASEITLAELESAGDFMASNAEAKADPKYQAVLPKIRAAIAHKKTIAKYREYVDFLHNTEWDAIRPTPPFASKNSKLMHTTLGGFGSGMLIVDRSDRESSDWTFSRNIMQHIAQKFRAGQLESVERPITDAVGDQVRILGIRYKGITPFNNDKNLRELSAALKDWLRGEITRLEELGQRKVDVADVREAVYTAIRMWVTIPPEFKLTDATDIVYDLGLDSLDTMTVTMSLEKSFGIEVPVGETLRTLGEIIEYIVQNAPANQAMMADDALADDAKAWIKAIGAINFGNTNVISKQKFEAMRALAREVFQQILDAETISLETAREYIKTLRSILDEEDKIDNSTLALESLTNIVFQVTEELLTRLRRGEFNPAMMAQTREVFLRKAQGVMSASVGKEILMPRTMLDALQKALGQLNQYGLYEERRTDAKVGVDILAGRVVFSFVLFANRPDRAVFAIKQDKFMTFAEDLYRIDPQAANAFFDEAATANRAMLIETINAALEAMNVLRAELPGLAAKGAVVRNQDHILNRLHTLEELLIPGKEIAKKPRWNLLDMEVVIALDKELKKAIGDTFAQFSSEENSVADFRRKLNKVRLVLLESTLKEEITWEEVQGVVQILKGQNQVEIDKISPQTLIRAKLLLEVLKKSVSGEWEFAQDAIKRIDLRLKYFPEAGELEKEFRKAAVNRAMLVSKGSIVWYKDDRYEVIAIKKAELTIHRVDEQGKRKSEQPIKVKRDAVTTKPRGTKTIDRYGEPPGDTAFGTWSSEDGQERGTGNYAMLVTESTGEALGALTVFQSFFNGVIASNSVKLLPAQSAEFAQYLAAGSSILGALHSASKNPDWDVPEAGLLIVRWRRVFENLKKLDVVPEFRRDVLPKLQEVDTRLTRLLVMERVTWDDVREVVTILESRDMRRIENITPKTLIRIKIFMEKGQSLPEDLRQQARYSRMAIDLINLRISAIKTQQGSPTELNLLEKQLRALDGTPGPWDKFDFKEIDEMRRATIRDFVNGGQKEVTLFPDGSWIISYDRGLGFGADHPHDHLLISWQHGKFNMTGTYIEPGADLGEQDYEVSIGGQAIESKNDPVEQTGLVGDQIVLFVDPGLLREAAERNELSRFKHLLEVAGIEIRKPFDRAMLGEAVTVERLQKTLAEIRQMSPEQLAQGLVALEREFPGFGADLNRAMISGREDGTGRVVTLLVIIALVGGGLTWRITTADKPGEPYLQLARAIKQFVSNPAIDVSNFTTTEKIDALSRDPMLWPWMSDIIEADISRKQLEDLRDQEKDQNGRSIPQWVKHLAGKVLITQKARNRAMLSPFIDPLVKSVEALKITDFTSSFSAEKLDDFRGRLLKNLVLLRGSQKLDEPTMREWIEALDVFAGDLEDQSSSAVTAVRKGLDNLKDELLDHFERIGIVNATIERLNVPNFNSPDPTENSAVEIWRQFTLDALRRFKDGGIWENAMQTITALKDIAHRITTTPGSSAERQGLQKEITQTIEQFERIINRNIVRARVQTLQQLLTLSGQAAVGDYPEYAHMRPGLESLSRDLASATRELARLKRRNPAMMATQPIDAAFNAAVAEIQTAQANLDKSVGAGGWLASDARQRLAANFQTDLAILQDVRSQLAGGATYNGLTSLRERLENLAKSEPTDAVRAKIQNVQRIVFSSGFFVPDVTNTVNALGILTSVAEKIVEISSGIEEGDLKEELAQDLLSLQNFHRQLGDSMVYESGMTYLTLGSVITTFERIAAKKFSLGNLGQEKQESVVNELRELQKNINKALQILNQTRWNIRAASRAMLAQVVDRLIRDITALKIGDFSSPDAVEDINAWKRKLVETLQPFRSLSEKDIESISDRNREIEVLQGHFAGQTGKTFGLIQAGLKKLEGEVHWIAVRVLVGEELRSIYLRNVTTLLDTTENQRLTEWRQMVIAELTRVRDSQEKTGQVLISHGQAVRAINSVIKATPGRQSTAREWLTEGIDAYLLALGENLGSFVSRAMMSQSVESAELRAARRKVADLQYAVAELSIPVALSFGDNTTEVGRLDDLTAQLKTAQRELELLAQIPPGNLILATNVIDGAVAKLNAVVNDFASPDKPAFKGLGSNAQERDALLTQLRLSKEKLEGFKSRLAGNLSKRDLFPLIGELGQFASGVGIGPSRIRQLIYTDVQRVVRMLMREWRGKPLDPDQIATGITGVLESLKIAIRINGWEQESTVIEFRDHWAKLELAIITASPTIAPEQPEEALIRGIIAVWNSDPKYASILKSLEPELTLADLEDLQELRSMQASRAMMTDLTAQIDPLIRNIQELREIDFARAFDADQIPAARRRSIATLDAIGSTEYWSATQQLNYISMLVLLESRLAKKSRQALVVREGLEKLKRDLALAGVHQELRRIYPVLDRVRQTEKNNPDVEGKLAKIDELLNGGGRYQGLTGLFFRDDLLHTVPEIQAKIVSILADPPLNEKLAKTAEGKKALTDLKTALDDMDIRLSTVPFNRAMMGQAAESSKLAAARKEVRDLQSIIEPLEMQYPALKFRAEGRDASNQQFSDALHMQGRLTVLRGQLLKAKNVLKRRELDEITQRSTPWTADELLFTVIRLVDLEIPYKPGRFITRYTSLVSGLGLDPEQRNALLMNIQLAFNTEIPAAEEDAIKIVGDIARALEKALQKNPAMLAITFIDNALVSVGTARVNFRASVPAPSADDDHEREFTAAIDMLRTFRERLEVDPKGNDLSSLLEACRTFAAYMSGETPASVARWEINQLISADLQSIITTLDQLGSGTASRAMLPEPVQKVIDPLVKKITALRRDDFTPAFTLKQLADFKQYAKSTFALIQDVEYLTVDNQRTTAQRINHLIELLKLQQGRVLTPVREGLEELKRELSMWGVAQEYSSLVMSVGALKKISGENSEVGNIVNKVDLLLNVIRDNPLEEILYGEQARSFGIGNLIGGINSILNGRPGISGALDPKLAKTQDGAKHLGEVKKALVDFRGRLAIVLSSRAMLGSIKERAQALNQVLKALDRHPVVITSRPVKESRFSRLWKWRQPVALVWRVRGDAGLESGSTADRPFRKTSFPTAQVPDAVKSLLLSLADRFPVTFIGLAKDARIQKDLENSNFAGRYHSIGVRYTIRQGRNTKKELAELGRKIKDELERQKEILEFRISLQRDIFSGTPERAVIRFLHRRFPRIPRITLQAQLVSDLRIKLLGEGTDLVREFEEFADMQTRITDEAIDSMTTVGDFAREVEKAVTSGMSDAQKIARLQRRQDILEAELHVLSLADGQMAQEQSEPQIAVLRQQLKDTETALRRLYPESVHKPELVGAGEAKGTRNAAMMADEDIIEAVRAEDLSNVLLDMLQQAEGILVAEIGKYDKGKGSLLVHSRDEADTLLGRVRGEIARRPSGASQAMMGDSTAVTPAVTPGGMDITNVNATLQIKRDGNGVALPMNLQPLETINANIQGIMMLEIIIKPMINLPLRLGVAQPEPEAELSSI